VVVRVANLRLTEEATVFVAERAGALRLEIHAAAGSGAAHLGGWERAFAVADVALHVEPEWAPTVALLETGVERAVETWLRLCRKYHWPPRYGAQAAPRTAAAEFAELVEGNSDVVSAAAHSELLSFRRERSERELAAYVLALRESSRRDGRPGRC
jgi:hypothetical protein